MSLDSVSRALDHEAQAILHLSKHVPVSADLAVSRILNGKGRVITCGLGKSGHIARKAAGTFASTGTPSLFLHAAEAVHGDLGMVTSNDIVLMLTQSGETEELVRLFPSLRAIGATIILVTGRPESTAARLCDIALDTGVREEACPINLAPTTSTTVMLALCDALAVAVMEARGFGQDDFAKFHPSGSLGKRLLLTVRDIMRVGHDLATVRAEASILDVMKSIGEAGAGSACVIDENFALVGFISDGDLRRHFVNSRSPLNATAKEVMVQKVLTIEPDLLAVDALEVFQNHPVKIGEMPVVESGKVIGLLMLKDLLRSGIV